MSARASVLVSAQGRVARRLDIYVIDVEGGNATLVVAPSGESLLIDSGNVGAGAVRDASRIVSAAKNAGLSRIDHAITTHWHGDHYGGLAEVAARIPIADFVDHGANIQPTEATTAFLTDVYPGLYARATHTVVKPGDMIPLGAVTVRVVSSAGQVLKTPLVKKAQPFDGIL